MWPGCSSTSSASRSDVALTTSSMPSSLGGHSPKRIQTVSGRQREGAGLRGSHRFHRTGSMRLIAVRRLVLLERLEARGEEVVLLVGLTHEVEVVDARRMRCCLH